MYKVYAICYDRKSPLKNYAPFYNAIKNSSKWWHFLDATWLVCTNETAEQISARLRPHLGKADNLLVIEVRKDANGWLPKGAWDWINQYASP
jgi:hypothetical protein